MRHILLLIVTFSLAAADFETAEQLFAAGKFDQCAHVVDELLKGNPPEKQRTRLLAIQEYLKGATQAKIAETVKQAKEIAAHPDWLNEDLLNHSAMLIRRAEDWKARGIPEYQELADIADVLLKRTKDDGDPEIALKIIFLLTRNDNLNGEYTEPLKRILETLQLYYPSYRNKNSDLPPGAIQLLMLAGEQYVGRGVRSHNVREKTNAFSQAAKFYLRVAQSISPKDSRYPELCDRLQLCRETLRLLGFQLRLPKEISPRRPIQTSMIDSLIKEKRFHDVILALENNPAPAMQIRLAFALTSCGELDKAWKIVSNPDLKIEESALLLLTARNFLAAGRKNEAAMLFAKFMELAPDAPDAFATGQQYAQIQIEAGHAQAAAVALLKLADATQIQTTASAARFAAAQCFYLAGDYEKCLSLVDNLPSEAEYTLLAGQAEIKQKNFRAAMVRLKPLLSSSENYRTNALKLLIRCGMEENSQETATYVLTLLDDYPADPERLEYAQILYQIYDKQAVPAVKYSELGSWAIQHLSQTEKSLSLIAHCAIKLPENQEVQLIQQLLKRETFRDSELLILFDQLRNRKLKLEFFHRYCRTFSPEPERCDLFLKAAELKWEERKSAEALTLCDQLLSQEKIWKYKEIQWLRMKILMDLNRFEEARETGQELLLTQLSPTEKRKTVLLQAEAWEQSAESGKAIAVAWTVIPVDTQACTEEDKLLIQNLLQLIIRNADQIKSSEDKEDATELLRLFFPEHS